MSITVRYFASIRESLGKSEEHIDAREVACVADVWNQVAGSAAPLRILAAVNQEYADLARKVGDGDEVAFFPPVTGG
jgi:molybdopterin synthase sulfur carrier subunit